MATRSRRDGRQAVQTLLASNWRRDRVAGSAIERVFIATVRFSISVTEVPYTRSRIPEGQNRELAGTSVAQFIPALRGSHGNVVVVHNIGLPASVL